MTILEFLEGTDKRWNDPAIDVPRNIRVRVVRDQALRRAYLVARRGLLCVAVPLEPDDLQRDLDDESASRRASAAISAVLVTLHDHELLHEIIAEHVFPFVRDR